jgi:hypothetical protein
MVQSGREMDAWCGLVLGSGGFKVKKIYLIYGQTGDDIESSQEWAVRAFEDNIEAEEFLQKAQKKADELREERSKFKGATYWTFKLESEYDEFVYLMKESMSYYIQEIQLQEKTNVHD